MTPSPDLLEPSERKAPPTRRSGPVSLALEQELLAEIRRQGIVVWLDKDSSYVQFVQGLAARHTAGEFPFPVVGFGGSFLETLFALEPFGGGLERQPLLLHMPGFNEESIRKTPVLEMYEAGVRFRKSLDTLIREAAAARATPAEVEAFLATKPGLEAADTWLEEIVSPSLVGLAALLDEMGSELLLEALARPDAKLARRVTSADEAAILESYLHKATGMDAPWIDLTDKLGDRTATRFDRLLDALAAWILCVEYVHDLRRPAHRSELRRLGALSAPLIRACRDLVARLRGSEGDAYERLALEVAGYFADELREMTPEDLGQIDTFREEENTVLSGAVEALRQGDWARAGAWSAARKGEKSFWLQRDQLRRWAWSLVDEAAELGKILGEHARPFAGATSLEQATESYAAGAFAVDRAHRRFEQKRHALLDPRLPHHGPLLEIASELRRAHRAWADRLTRDFAALGFLPAPSLQQRNLFEQVVHPLARTGETVAFFLIDAFRYEMATELVDELMGPGVVVDLKPRLAELPTITAVGMNALAPVASQTGRLTVAGTFQGFKNGESTVRTPDDRANAMGRRSAGKPALPLKLGEVSDKSTVALAKIVKAHPLVVVHSREIDDAGEVSLGLPTFESTLRQVKAAWHHLQLAGVKNFVFTADHGFLLQDETTQLRKFGSKRDPERRYVLDEHPREESGMIPISLSSLGYDGLTGYLLFRDDTAVFATGKTGASFVHGGLSPQERIIPVLTVTRTRREAAGYSELAVEVEPQDDVMGHHRLRLRVVNAPGTLGFVTAREVDIALRVPGREEIRVVVKDVSRPARLKTGRLQVPVGEGWSEVFFHLEGPADERVRLEVHHADNIENIASVTPAPWYTVNGLSPSTAKAPPPPKGMPAWAETIDDGGVRKVLLHLDKHGVITEAEATGMLGSTRAFRRFSADLEIHLEKVPFRVRVEPGDSGKRYVREDDR